MSARTAHAMPSIAAYWVKNNVLAAVISAAVSFSIFSLKSAAGVTVPGAGLGPFVIVHVFAIALWAVSGSAAGLFTGAALRRIIPIFPIRIWITLHAVIAVVAGLGSAAIAIMSSAAKGIVDVSVGEKLLAGFLVGTVIGVAVGGVEALVLRKVAIGAGRWFTCSIAAFAIAVSLFGNARLWETGGGFAGELAHNAITFLGAMTISLVMLPAVRHLRDPLMSKASPHFD